MAATIVPTFQIGDLVAWESQAAGSWKTKIGRVTKLPISSDARTTSGKVELSVLASYPIWSNTDIGHPRDVTPAKSGRVIGRANPSSLRTPTAAEKKAIS